MATDVAPAPVNGSFTPHQGQPYLPIEQNAVVHSSNSLPLGTSANGADSVQDISKEEVGWYFVERYYTTLSKKPENLFLFYNKRSQSVFGVEDEKVPVCVGQRAINDRMKELDFHDTKIRVTNVDSQESGSDIVIQVIGEISNKSEPHRKFVQTFVLARQTNGYFVLNDIFRYIAEEEDEIVDQEEATRSGALASGYQEPAPIVTRAEPKTSTKPSKADGRERDAHVADEELEKVADQEPKQDQAAAPQVNGASEHSSKQIVEADEAPAAAASTSEPAAAPELELDQSKDPEPSPKRAPAAPAASKAAPAPAKPAAPKTWASLAASANRTAPATAAPSNPTPSAPQTAPKPTPQPASTAPSAPAAPAQAREAIDSEGQQSDGWQAVGSGHDRKQSRAQGQVSAEAPRSRAYIKNVYASIEADALKNELTKYGEITYFDISRQKNAAFIDFATPAAFQAAVAANPHQIGNDQIYVEERRERPFQFQPRGGMRGGRGGTDIRPGQGRGGFGKENGRGGFQPRGRGGSVTPRGRGNGQTA